MASRRDSIDDGLLDGDDTEPGQNISGLLQISALNDNNLIDYEE